MNNTSGFNNRFRIIKQVYIFVYITYVMLARIVPAAVVLTPKVSTLFFSAIAICGLIILAIDFFTSYFIFKSKENILLTAFLAIAVISSFINREYGIVNNAKTIAWSAIQYFVLFSIVNINDETEIKTTITRIMKASSAIWFVCVLVSVAQFLVQVGYRAPFVDYPRRQGFFESRLFGIFTDPNLAAVTSVLIVLFCWMLLKNCNKKATIIYYYINIAFQIIYIVLSGSRTAIYGGMMIAFVVGVLSKRNKLIDEQSIKVVLKSILSGVMTVAACIVLIFVVKSTMPLLAEACTSCCGTFFEESNSSRIEDPETILKRDDINEDNISNNRFSIWKDYIHISADHRLFGLSPRNLALYAKDHYPDSYVVYRGYETHNGWLSILVCTGVAGVAVMLAFFVLYLREFIQYIKAVKGEKCELEVIMLFSAVLLLAFSGVLYPELFFTNTYGTLIFWLFMGYLLYFMKRETAK